MFGFPRLGIAHRGAWQGTITDRLTSSGASVLRWGGLGAGGRHQPPYATTLDDTNLIFRESSSVSKGAVRVRFHPRLGSRYWRCSSSICSRNEPGVDSFNWLLPPTRRSPRAPQPCASTSRQKASTSHCLGPLACRCFVFRSSRRTQPHPPPLEAELPGSCCQLSYKIGARANEWPMNHECIWDTCRLTNGVNNVRVHDYFTAASASGLRGKAP
jgi:hypothetical protein